MRVQDARTLAANAAVYYKNLVNLISYAAKVTTAGTPTSVGITVTSTSQVMTFNLATDNQAEIPVYPLS